MKQVGELGLQLRRALNEQRGFVSAEDISAALYEASTRVFGHKRGHSALYRPGQPLPPQGYQLTTVLDIALNPFLRVQRYVRGYPGQDELQLSDEGVLLFPQKLDPVTGQPILYFQYPVSLAAPGARAWRHVNANALAQTQANSLTAPTLALPLYSSVPGGYKVLPEGLDQVDLEFLAAPPKPVFAEMDDPNEPGNFIYDDANSVDLGWTDVTALNEIRNYATIYLGGQVKDQQAIQLATQTAALGA